MVDPGVAPLTIDRTRQPRLLDGVYVASSTATLAPFAAIIENHVDARPVAGLEHARIIYETIVEGDITRFLAIFDGATDVKKIGPIRSARPFLVHLAQQWNPILFHAGGSPEALELLRQSTMHNINEISADGIYFWRASYRSAPHNLYTSSAQMVRAQQARQAPEQGTFQPYRFKADTPTSSPAVPEVTLPVSPNSAYVPVFVYNSGDNDYTRYQAGEIHTSESGIVLKAKNIIEQRVAADVIDTYGRLDVDVLSSGACVVYRDGAAIPCTWQFVDGRTHYLDPEGQPILFNRGTIWIGLVFTR